MEVTAKKLLPLFLNQAFRGVAVSFLAFFNSIFIYKVLMRLTGEEKIAVFAVAFYFLGLYSFKFLANMLAENWAQVSGLKRQIYIGEVLFALVFIFLLLASNQPALLVLASIFWGLSTGFYWFSWHSFIVKEGEEHYFGRNLGSFEIARTILLLAAPLAGGAIIALFGYPGLYLVSLVFILISVACLAPVPVEKIHHDTHLVDVFRLFATHPKMFSAYFGNAAAGTIYGTLFPLYLYLILRQEFSLGEFFTFSMVLAALISFLVGRWVDLKGKKEPLALGSAVSSLVWIGRTVARTPSTLLIYDVIDRITGGMTGIPLSVLSYEKALDGHSTGRAVLFRELALTLGSITACLMTMIVVLLGFRLEAMFLLAAVFSLAPLLIINDGQKKSG